MANGLVVPRQEGIARSRGAVAVEGLRDEFRTGNIQRVVGAVLRPEFGWRPELRDVAFHAGSQVTFDDFVPVRRIGNRDIELLCLSHGLL